MKLLDRSGRRCSLLARAVRILGLDNVEIVQADVAQVHHGADIVVSRGSLPPERLLPHLERLSAELGIVAASTQREPDIPGYETQKIVSRYLDSPRWLLIMRAS